MSRATDAPVPRSPWTPLLEQAGLPGDFLSRSASGRLRALLDLRDPGRFLRQLRPDEAGYLLLGIGLEDAAPLLPYLAPEQRQVLVDLEAFAGTRFLPERLDHLLDIARDLSVDFALRWVSELPPEVIALRIARAATEIWTSDEVENHPLPDVGVLQSPDAVFTLVLADSEEVGAMRQWLDLLWSWDLEEAHRLLHAVRREVPSSLEDEALRFREARLQDWGFPCATERFSLYEPLDRGDLSRRLRLEAGTDVSRPEDPGPFRAVVPIPGGEPAPLAGLLALLSGSPRLAWFASETSLLVHRALAALEEDWANPEARDRAAAHVLRWMSIGVEDLTGPGGIPLEVLARRGHPTDLFRAGFETIRPGQLLARQVIAHLGGRSHLRVLEEFQAALVEALAAFPPRVVDALPPHGPRDPEHLAEVRKACQVVREAHAVTRFAVEALGFHPGRSEVGPESGTVAGALATAWAWGILTGETSIRPLSAQDIRNLRLAAFEGSRIRPALRQPAAPDSSESDPDEQAVRRMLGRALDRVEEALGGLDPAQTPDLRFLGDALFLEVPAPPRAPGPAGTRDGDSQ